MASSVTLTELRGGAVPGREIELRGPSLPFQEAAWEGEQRLKTVYPAGNPEATQHVLGPRELPSQWEGMWRLTQMIGAPAVFRNVGSETLVTHPADLRDLVENFRVEGTLLRVTWSSDDREVVRLGRIKRARFPHTR